MKKLWMLFMVAGVLGLATESRAAGWKAFTCVEESTATQIAVYLEDRGPQRSLHFFQGQNRVVLGGVTYAGQFTRELIQDRTRLDGYYRIALRAEGGRQGAQVSASLIQSPGFDTAQGPGAPGDRAFGHIEFFIPGTRHFKQYLVHCSLAR